MKNEIMIFENQNIKLEVNLKDETVWLSLDQMAKLFDRDKSVISRHIKNALDEELTSEAVVAKFATTSKHGAMKDKMQTHMVNHYNLDMIISVGYRVKSLNGVLFRKWATKVLKEYLIKGYAVNQKRLEYLEKTVKLIDIASRVETDESKSILKVINRYSSSLDLLDDYDHKKLDKPQGTISEDKITYEECKSIIEMLRFNNESSIFALERNKGLESVINNIYQSFGGEDVYPTIEEKAANFLYLIVKNHVFIDGNKRIAATLFIAFLHLYNILFTDEGQIIDNNTLVALTLLIAESNPKEKEVLISLIMNFLCNK